MGAQDRGSERHRRVVSPSAPAIATAISPAIAAPAIWILQIFHGLLVDGLDLVFPGKEQPDHYESKCRTERVSNDTEQTVIVR